MTRIGDLPSEVLADDLTMSTKVLVFGGVIAITGQLAHGGCFVKVLDDHNEVSQIKIMFHPFFVFQGDLWNACSGDRQW